VLWLEKVNKDFRADVDTGDPEIQKTDFWLVLGYCSEVAEHQK